MIQSIAFGVIVATIIVAGFYQMYLMIKEGIIKNDLLTKKVK